MVTMEKNVRHVLIFSPFCGKMELEIVTRY